MKLIFFQEHLFLPVVFNLVTFRNKTAYFSYILLLHLYRQSISFVRAEFNTILLRCLNQKYVYMVFNCCIYLIAIFSLTLPITQEHFFKELRQLKHVFQRMKKYAMANLRTSGHFVFAGFTISTTNHITRIHNEPYFLIKLYSDIIN